MATTVLLMNNVLPPLSTCTTVLSDTGIDTNKYQRQVKQARDVLKKANKEKAMKEKEDDENTKTRRRSKEIVLEECLIDDKGTWSSEDDDEGGIYLMNTPTVFTLYEQAIVKRMSMTKKKMNRTFKIFKKCARKEKEEKMKECSTWMNILLPDVDMVAEMNAIYITQEGVVLNGMVEWLNTHAPRPLEPVNECPLLMYRAMTDAIETTIKSSAADLVLAIYQSQPSMQRICVQALVTRVYEQLYAEQDDDVDVSINLGLWHLFLDLVEAPTKVSQDKVQDVEMESMLAVEFGRTLVVLLQLFVRKQSVCMENGTHNVDFVTQTVLIYLQRFPQHAQQWIHRNVLTSWKTPCSSGQVVRLYVIHGILGLWRHLIPVASESSLNLMNSLFDRIVITQGLFSAHVLVVRQALVLCTNPVLQQLCICSTATRLVRLLKALHDVHKTHWNEKVQQMAEDLFDYLLDFS